MDRELMDLTLSINEIERIEEGLPDLEEWSRDLLVPFNAFKVDKPDVLWINKRWFLSKGIDVTSPRTVERLKNWLVDKFAYVTDSLGTEGLDLKKPVILRADRYGSNSGLFAHGGSGRAAAIGKFHVKGVGATPLVGAGVNREHSHGCASLNVAIREAIFSEICAEEFPFGAVPTIAIIDTNLKFESSSKAGKYLRRALIVRPAMLRAAHMQRSPGFIKPVDGHVNSQLADVRRVKDCIQKFVAECVDPRSASGLTEHFSRLADQIAFGQAQRLYSGGYFSSNLSLQGELLDFGNAHALPDWSNAKVLDNDAGFGQEMDVVFGTIQSLCFYFGKYLLSHFDRPDQSEIEGRIKSHYDAAIRREMLRLFGLQGLPADASTERLFSLLFGFFRRQQRSSINYSRGAMSSQGWLLEGRWQEKTTPVASEAAVLISDIVAELSCVLEKHEQSNRSLDGALRDASRYLLNRDKLERTYLQACVEKLLGSYGEDVSKLKSAVERFVSEHIDQNRRHWPRLPSEFVVKASVTGDGSSALMCCKKSTLDEYLWLEGACLDDEFLLFGKRVSEQVNSRMNPVIDGARWSAYIQIDPADVSGWHALTSELDVPSMTQEFTNLFESYCVAMQPIRSSDPPNR